jgi:hypothetical protein
MDLEQQIRVLQAAQGDPARLALATVDLAYPSLPEAERTTLKEALQATAIPHWCDEAILSVLQEISQEESAARLARLRRLSVVETFFARGSSAVNVHETTRLALRAWLDKEQPERFLLLSERAYSHFSKVEDPPASIEAAFHRAAIEPKAGRADLCRLSLVWQTSRCFAESRALAVVLDELRNFPSSALLARIGASLGQANTERQREVPVSMERPELTMREMLEAGVHFGHRTDRWNPKMKPYLFGVRNGIYIVDLQKTVPLFSRACHFLDDLTAKGEKVLFVGTKKQAKEVIKEEAVKAGQFYVNNRWLGGTLTNYPATKSSIERLKSIERMAAKQRSVAPHPRTPEAREEPRRHQGDDQAARRHLRHRHKEGTHRGR